MKDKTLYKICIAISFIGILLLYTVTYVTAPSFVEIENIDNNHIGSNVRTRGEVVEKHITEEGHMFFDLEDGEHNIDVVIFESHVESYSISPEEIPKNSYLEIEGEVDIYRDDLQIIPRKIEIID